MPVGAARDLPIRVLDREGVMGQSRDVARSSDTPPSKGLRRFTVIWVIITLLSAPFVYGIFSS